MASTPTVAGQHVLDADYFRRIEALNFTMLHDDGHLPENLDDADILLVGISRTSKTPTSIYLANRGYKTANVPLIPGVPLPPKLEARTNAFVVGLVASAERISQVRQNRVLEHAASHLRHLCGPRGDCRGDRRDPPALRAAGLAGDRRDSPLYRGDRGRDSSPLSRPRGAGARPMNGFLQSGRPPLILASSSKVRARLLEAAGLAFIVEGPGLDEHAMRQAISSTGSLSPQDVAEVLARAKAEAISELARDAFVIGADQVLALGDRILTKPDSMETARAELLDFSGKRHTLHSAVALATKGETVWAYAESSTLVMRKLTPQFVGRYLAAAGDEVLSSVGAYQIEGLGIQLFEKIDGDYFSILGLPLLPLLDALRREGAIEG